jgi:hypothetical protein
VATAFAERDYSRMNSEKQIRIAHEEMDKVTNTRLAWIEQRVEAVFGNIFYAKAMRAVLPGKRGRDDFRQVVAPECRRGRGY